MKRMICAILCLSILLTGMIGITAASADVPVIITHSTISVNPMTNGKLVYANVSGAPAKAGYYSCAIIKLTVKFKRYTDPKKVYPKTDTKSKNGEWGKGTGTVPVSVYRDDPRDSIVSAKADRTFQYYGIRND